MSIGLVVTWVLASGAAALFLGLHRDDALLLGSVLVVSGPTVVLPLLRHARVREPTGSILRWEGIFIDPIGATLSIVVLQVVLGHEQAAGVVGRILATAVVGTAAGLLGAALLTLFLARHWVADHLHNPFTLAVVVGAFAGADLLAPEAGLFATTVLGVAMANQRFVPTAHIREFEENLGLLILSGLFILLGARVDLDRLAHFAPGSLGLLAALVLVVRPAAVFASTIGSGLSHRERIYLACICPRGIVAAAVASLFTLELIDAGQPLPELVPATFVVIIGSVVLYGLAARPLARALHVAKAVPRGIALVGGPGWALELGRELAALDVPVILVSTDDGEQEAALDAGLLVFSGRIEADDLLEAMEGVGVSQAIALSRYSELNAFGMSRLADELGRANIWYLRPPRRTTSAATARRCSGGARSGAAAPRRPSKPSSPAARTSTPSPATPGTAPCGPEPCRWSPSTPPATPRWATAAGWPARRRAAAPSCSCTPTPCRPAPRPAGSAVRTGQQMSRPSVDSGADAEVRGRRRLPARRGPAPGHRRSSARACSAASASRRCWASPARASRPPWRGPSSRCSGPPSSSPRTRASPPSWPTSSASSSPTTRSSTSSATTTTTSPRPTSRARTPTSRRTRRSTTRSTGCATPPPRRSSPGGTSSSSRRCRASTASARPIEYAKRILHVQVGEEQDQRAILRRLVDLHYDRNDLNLVRGKFRVRGDTIEVHPAYDEHAVRIVAVRRRGGAASRGSTCSPARPSATSTTS